MRDRNRRMMKFKKNGCFKSKRSEFVVYTFISQITTNGWFNCREFQFIGKKVSSFMYFFRKKKKDDDDEWIFTQVQNGFHSYIHTRTIFIKINLVGFVEKEIKRRKCLWKCKFWWMITVNDDFNVIIGTKKKKNCRSAFEYIHK